MHTYYVSTAKDGSMKALNMRDAREVNKNQENFLRSIDLQRSDTTVINMTYGRENYTHFTTLQTSNKDHTINCDALIVTEPGHPLLLPLADCIGAVIHDPVKNILMLSHLGRHNLEQFGGTKSIEYLTEKFQCDPKSITVWLSPAAGKENYPLFAFNNRSMYDVATEQLITAGVVSRNITHSPIDVTKDSDYFSHSEFLQGNRENDGRFAVVTVMK